MPLRSWDIEEIKARGFRTGSILRVQMHNFITYDDAEVFPGPKLNIILGPNGTGKSTLTHAICLACVGMTSSVGRSSDLTHFIKRGKEREGSFCEVDLLLKNDTVVTIRRILNSETKGSKWQLNGRSSTMKEMKELMSSLHIDVDNLCSFMPQDRVSAFTQMNSKKLLQSTLECIKTPDGGTLKKEQDDLADIDSEVAKARRDVEAKVQALQTVEQQIRGMSGEVDRIHNRDKLQERVTMYDVRIAVLDLEEKAAEVQQKQVAIDVENKKLVDAQASLKPLDDRVRQLQREELAHEKSIKSVVEKKQKADERLDIAHARIEELDIEVETAKLNVESCAAMRRQQEENLHNLNESLEQLDKQYQASMKNVPRMQDQMKVFTEQYDTASSKISTLNDRLSTLKFDLRTPQSSVHDIQNQLNKVKDARDIFCSKLHGRDRENIVTAMGWINANRHRFHGECFGPVGAEVVAHSQEDAAMFEKLINLAKLKAFLVDNEDDEKLLNYELRDRMKLDLNITTIYNKGSKSQPYSRDILQRAKTSYALEGFLGDKLEMPDMVRAYLNSFLGIHTILCTRGPNASHLITLPVLHELSQSTHATRLFATDTGSNGNVKEVTYFTALKSRFASGGNDMPSTTSVTIRPAKFVGSMNQSDTQQHKAQLEADLAKARDAVHSIEEEMKLIRHDLEAAQVERDEHRNACKKLKNLLSQPEALKHNLLREEKKRNDLAHKLERDSGQERQRLVELLHSKVSELTQAVAEVHSRCDAALEATIWKDFISRSSRGKRDELFDAKQALDDANKKLIDIKYKVKELEGERNVANDQKVDAERVIEDLEVQLGSEAKLLDFFHRAAKVITETNREALIEKRDQLSGQLEATLDNPELLKQYEKLLQEAEKFRLDQVECEDKLNSLRSGSASRIAAFKQNVETLIQKLNVDFARFMEELNFAGEVSLNDEGGFLNHEVILKVNFHSNSLSGLHPLSGQSHSGGERSVSTVMYLMALQELTSAPFRVVDEINQGMDERNERLVFDRIVRSCCSQRTNVLPNTSIAASSSSSASATTTPMPPTTVSGVTETATVKAQYFLVSPKLLPGLRAMDNDDVTVLMVYNGPGVKDLWQMTDVISALKKRKHELLCA